MDLAFALLTLLNMVIIIIGLTETKNDTKKRR